MTCFVRCSVVLLLLGNSLCASGGIPGVPDFEPTTLPADGDPTAWEIVDGDGEFRRDERGRLQLRVSRTPTRNTHRLGATIDLGERNSECFVLDVAIDPASHVTGAGFNQLDCGITIGLPDRTSDPNRFQAEPKGLSLNIRDLSDVADYGVFWRGRDLSLPVPATRGTGNPRVLQRRDGAYRFRVMVSPSGAGSRIRVYHTQFVTPDWEGTIATRLRAGLVGVYARLGRHEGQPVETTIASLSLKPIAPEVANRTLTDAEHVLYALDLDHPGLEQVKAEMDAGSIETATTRFATYLRRRTNVTGPSVPTAPLTEREQRIADLMTEDKLLVYTGGPLFEHTFETPYDWAADPYKTGGQFAIYNSRMFPWLFMGRAYRATGEAKYPQTFVKQLNSWLDQIPLRIVATPNGDPFFIDGNTLEPPLLFTGNMGRRIELTWWQTFELFKTAPEFDDASLMRMMRYFHENARLVTNPSIFLAWDDSGLHMATGLLQCATMMPEWREADRWQQIAFDRLEQTFRSQVHTDGTHASLSTGYGWATIDSYRNVFEIMRRNGEELPPRFRNAIRGTIIGYMGLLRPDFGNISLNDGGWGPVDDKVREALPLFPNDAELEYFASRGASGTPPAWTSRYFPNAGWYAMRTGFGPREKMLFFDGGPFGASHGKQDALHLVLALGNTLLLRDGGRGDYTSKPTSRWSSQTFAFNTLTPDWAGQDRTHRYEHEKHVGRNPPERPWVSNAHFDYGRSSYDAGWYTEGRRIGGVHTRHVVFVTGPNPPATGYWIVVDQVTPDDDEPHTWRHPWHLATEEITLDEPTGSVTTNGGGANLRILPVDPDDNMTAQIVSGQREPVLQGWKVNGSEARPSRVPMHTWTTAGAFTKAWVLLPRAANQTTFEITGVVDLNASDDRLSFTLTRTDGGTDHISIAKGGTTISDRDGKEPQATSRLRIITKDRSGEARSRLDAR